MCQIKKGIKYQIAYMSSDIFFNLLVKTLSCNLFLDGQVKTSHSWCSFQKRSFHQTWSLLLITIFDHFEFLILFHCYSSSLISLVFIPLISAYKKKNPVCTWPHPSLLLHPPASVLIFGLFFLPSAVHSQSGRNHGNMVTLADDQLWGACDYDRLP